MRSPAFTTGKLLDGDPVCPSCSNVIDGITDVGHGRRPKDGDISVCAYCATVLVVRFAGAAFDHYEMLAPHELAELRAAYPELAKAEGVVRQAIRERGK